MIVTGHRYPPECSPTASPLDLFSIAFCLCMPSTFSERDLRFYIILRYIANNVWYPLLLKDSLCPSLFARNTAVEQIGSRVDALMFSQNALRHSYRLRETMKS